MTQTAYPNGLAEARGVGRELVRQGIATTVVCSRISNPGPGEPEMLEAGEWRGHPDEVRFSVNVARLLRRLKPDLVHVYAYRGCALLPLLARGPRYLFDLRTGNVGGRAWSRVADRITRYEALPYHGRAVISRAVGRYVCGTNWDDAPVLPLGYPAAGAAMARTAIRARLEVVARDPLRVGYVGTLHPQRRLERMIAAAALLHQRGCSVRWIVVGSGDGLPALERQANELGIAHLIEFRGPVTTDAVWEQYADMDVSLAYIPAVPEFYNQPPLKTVESMACGLPVIATDTVGNREFIRHEQDGLLVEDDPRALADAVARVASDRALRVRLGEAGSARAAEFSWERVVTESIIPAYTLLVRT